METQPIGLRLSLSDQNCAAISLLIPLLTKQRGFIPTSQKSDLLDQSNCEDSESSFALK